ncbi:Bifunctional protein FolD protein [Candidatus Norongarragalina meridionalis]|nr:Bifunctional protein FolD protein [Candidatus Norongarragalina meridionalis]
MSCRIIDGKALAEKIRSRITKEVASMKTKPCLSVVLVGEDSASKVYVSMKEVACIGAGMKSRNIKLPESTTEEKLLAEIRALNADKSVHAILVQVPLPKQINENRILESVAAEKDVDGFNPCNIGRLHSRSPTFVPATPKGIMRLLDEAGVELAGKHAVVVGRSNIVGKPVAALLLAADATVTQCHSKTKDLAAFTKQADVLVVAVGKPRMIKKDMVKKGAVVIDAGTSRDANGKLAGDVDESVRDVASAITPVPGGVGPMTIAMLLENTLRAARNQGCK